MAANGDAARGSQAGGVGRWGEEFAQNLLERRGYRIIDVNVQFGTKATGGRKGEIDIVAWDGPTLCFVEVKTRQGGRNTVLGEAVTPAKQKQIARLALLYATANDILSEEEIPLRFDVVSVVLRYGAAEETPFVVRADVLPGAFLAPDNWED